MDNRLLKVLKIRELFKGDRVEEYRTMCGHKVYLIREDKENQTLYIPDDVTLYHKAIGLIGKFHDIPCYNLICNMEVNSAQVAYDGLPIN